MKRLVSIILTVAVLTGWGWAGAIPARASNAETYDDASVYVADRLLKGFPKENGTNSAEYIPFHMSMSHLYTYIAMAEAAVDDKMLTINSVFWKNVTDVLDSDFLDLPTWRMLLYEYIMLDFLSESELYESYQSELLEKTDKYAIEIYSQLADTVKGMKKNTAQTMSSKMSEMFLKKYQYVDVLQGFTTIVKNIISDVDVVKDMQTYLSEALVLRDTFEEKKGFLTALMNVTRDKHLKGAIGDIIDSIEASKAEMTLVGGVLAVARQVVKRAGDFLVNLILDQVEESKKGYIDAKDNSTLGGIILAAKFETATLNALFDSNDASENNVRLVIMYCINSDILETVRILRDKFQNEHDHDSAEQFIDAYKYWLRYQEFATNWSRIFAEQITKEGWWKVIYNKISDKNLDRMEYLNKKFDEDIKISEKYLSLITQLYDSYDGLKEEEDVWVIVLPDEEEPEPPAPPSPFTYALQNEYPYGSYTGYLDHDFPYDYDNTEIPLARLGYIVDDLDEDGEDELLYVQTDEERKLILQVYEYDSGQGEVYPSGTYPLSYPATGAPISVSSLGDCVLDVFLYEDDGTKIGVHLGARGFFASGISFTFLSLKYDETDRSITLQGEVHLTGSGIENDPSRYAKTLKKLVKLGASDVDFPSLWYFEKDVKDYMNEVREVLRITTDRIASDAVNDFMRTYERTPAQVVFIHPLEGLEGRREGISGDSDPVAGSGSTSLITIIDRLGDMWPAVAGCLNHYYLMEDQDHREVEMDIADGNDLWDAIYSFVLKNNHAHPSFTYTLEEMKEIACAMSSSFDGNMEMLTSVAQPGYVESFENGAATFLLFTPEVTEIELLAFKEQDDKSLDAVYIYNSMRGSCYYAVVHLMPGSDLGEGGFPYSISRVDFRRSLGKGEKQEAVPELSRILGTYIEGMDYDTYLKNRDYVQSPLIMDLYIDEYGIFTEYYGSFTSADAFEHYYLFYDYSIDGNTITCAYFDPIVHGDRLEKTGPGNMMFEYQDGVLVEGDRYTWYPIPKEALGEGLEQEAESNEADEVNVENIETMEALQEAPEESSSMADVAQEYVLPGSDARFITEEELVSFSPEELRLARNEIYARHGRRFRNHELQEYFDAQPWYDGTIDPDDFENSVFNQYERKNIDVIQAVEARYQN